CQPTLHPLQGNVRTFFFHAYNAAWERPLNFDAKKYGMFYVGNNWFRWGPMRRVLEALESIRSHVGPIALTGYGWDSPPPWTNATLIEAAYQHAPEYLRHLDVEVHPPIHFARVIDAMGEGVFTPVIYRPLFDHLRLVTCRTFETIAANTIPLFGFDASFAEEVYGPAAAELVLPTNRPQDKILDVLGRPGYYAATVAELRGHLAVHHSYAARLQQLLDIVRA